MFNFTPLLGAQSSSPASQSILEFEGGIKVLVDCGWRWPFNAADLKELEKHVPSLSLILLTHATLNHIAAYAHCCKHFPLFLQIPVYATQPVVSLGRTLLQDLYSSTPLAASVIPSDLLNQDSNPASSDDAPKILLQPPSRDEVASYFQRIHPLKYSQPHEPTPSSFSPPLNGLTITAYNAGHSLGGTIWHIVHGMESVVYAVDWNQVRENVFNRAAWLVSGGGAEIIEQLRKPTALISSTRGVEKNPHASGITKRDELLLDMIRAALVKGGSVLVPTDATARVLELAYVVEHAWRQQARLAGEHPFKSTKVYLASKSIGTTMRYARSMLEWMDDSMVREAEADPSSNITQYKKPGEVARNQHEDAAFQAAKAGQNGPFDFKYVRLIERQTQMAKVLSKPEPKVILASDTTLDWGFSQDVLMQIASDPKSLVILTEDLSVPGPVSQGDSGIGQILWNWYNTREHGVAVESGTDGQKFEQVYTGGMELSYNKTTLTPLEGAELGIYQQYLATQKQVQDLEGLGEGNLEHAADVPDDAASASSSESEESDSERQGKALNYSTTVAQTGRKQTAGKEAVGVNLLLKEPNMYDYDVRGKKGRDSIFPNVVKKRRIDEFGEVIRPEDYLRAEERDETDGQAILDEQKDLELGKKRKWGDLDLLTQKDRRQAPSVSKRRKGDNDLANGALSGENLEDDHSSNSEVDEADENDEGFVPSKLITTIQRLSVQLRLGFVDFAGLHDQRNMSLLIPLIKPRRIVLIGGTEADTSFLAIECKQKFMQGSVQSDGYMNEVVLTPSNGERVEASMDTNAWTVRLSDALVRKIHWQTVGRLDVVTLAGRLAATNPFDSPEDSAARVKRQKILKSEDGPSEHADEAKAKDLPPTLDILPASFVGGTRSVAQPLHVGDLRLADLRKILINEGHTADFRGQGTLVVDGKVAVRKSTNGRIEIESGEGLGEKQDSSRQREMPFFAVKRRIYEGLAVISGR